MDTNSDESDYSDYEIEINSEKPYKLLKNGNYKIKVNDIFRCPFCPHKKKQNYKYNGLHAHASGIAKGSSRRHVNQKANHLALVKYLENDLSHDNELPTPQIPPSSQEYVSSVGSEPSGPIIAETGMVASDIYVWPWMGIIMKPLCTTDNKNKLIDSTYWLEELAIFNPLEVTTIWIEQDSIVAIVTKFNSGMSGFKSVMELEKECEVNQCSKKEWTDKIGDWRSKAYGWCARADDYYSQGLIAEYLSTVGKLRNFSDIAKEEAQSTNIVVADLSDKITMKSEDLKKVQYKYNEKVVSLHNVLVEKDRLEQAGREGIVLKIDCLCSSASPEII